MLRNIVPMLVNASRLWLTDEHSSSGREQTAAVIDNP